MSEIKTTAPAATTAEDENHIIAERRAKLARLREQGVAYPNDFVREDLFGDLRATWGNKSKEEIEAANVQVASLRSYDAQAHHGQGLLCHRARLHWATCSTL